MVHFIVVFVTKEGASIPVVVDTEVVEGIEIRCVVVLMRMDFGGSRRCELVGPSLIFQISDYFLQRIVLSSKILCLGCLRADGLVTLELELP